MVENSSLLDLFSVKLLNSKEEVTKACGGFLGAGWKSRDDLFSVCSSLLVDDPTGIWCSVSLVLCCDGLESECSVECVQPLFDSIRGIVLNDLDRTSSALLQKRLEGCYLWNLTDYPEVKVALEKQERQALLLVLIKGVVADIFHCNYSPLPACMPSVSSFLSEPCCNVSRDSGINRVVPSCSSSSVLSSFCTQRSSVPLLDRQTLRVLCERLGAPSVAALSCSSGTSSNDNMGSSNDAVSASSPSRDAKGGKESCNLVVNVAHLLDLGCRCLKNGKAGYAEKILLKALDIVDTMISEALQHIGDANFSARFADGLWNDLFRSQGCVLAWTAIAQMVQGKYGEVHNWKGDESIPARKTWVTNPLVVRLEENVSLFPLLWQEPTNEISRAITLDKLLAAAFVTPIFTSRSTSFFSMDIVDGAQSSSFSSHENDKSNGSGTIGDSRISGVSWSGEDRTCSQHWLREYLTEHPMDVACRRKLLITVFLAGDLEQCFTELLKLHSLGDTVFTREVMSILKDFCGADHPLVLSLSEKCD